MRILVTFITYLRLVYICARENKDYQTYQYETINEAHREIYSSILDLEEGKQPIRKCCLGDEYYSTLTQDCRKVKDESIFQIYVDQLLIPQDYAILSSVYKRIKACPGTLNLPKNVIVTTNSSHQLLEDGSVFDFEENILYNITHYCLEVVGNSDSNLQLVFAYCPPRENYVSKCCPKGFYFDSRISDCEAYYYVNGTEGDVTLSPYLGQGHDLRYQELLCEDPPSVEDLRTVYFREEKLCLENVEHCYATDKYCIDNYLDTNDNSMYPIAFVCPDLFINKCCPDQKSLFVGGCTPMHRKSVSMFHMLKNYRYKIKSTSQQGRKCSPITIEEETRSDIPWEINSFGQAVINKGDKTIYTRNYCIDDYITGKEIIPVIKVCSEEIDVYHKVSSISKWGDAVGKCCPAGEVYHPNYQPNGIKQNETSPSCVKEKEFVGSSLYEFKNQMPRLVYSAFPTCPGGNGFYHHFQILNKSKDYAELNSEKILKIVTIENGCRHKETILKLEDFCMDFIAYENTFEPVAIVCSPNAEPPHPERNAMTLSFIGISCGALVLTFFSLIFMRVRRGMVTMKKINTLAGRILLSYVSAQLISFISLSVGALVDFEEDIFPCFIIGGLILFFSVASFCWNTSICLEGLILTLHVKTSEGRRFFFHCLWAWGVPAMLTTLALVRDSRRKKLPCDAITPKFGLEQCFFSDLVAKILYFFLPISLSVILNGILLVTAKIVRRRQLKELERDPNRIRRHGTLKQVFSIKNRKSIKEEKRHLRAVHSGLRRHHFQNIWIETTKLALWSGITWIMELVAAGVTLHFGPSRGEWYQYLWYIPVGFNCFRGVGIFIIIVLTPENKTKFAQTIRTIYSNVGQSITQDYMGQSRKSTNKRRRDTVHRKSVSHGKDQDRKVSVSTVLTYISASKSSSESSGDSIKRPAEFCHSVSEIDIRRYSNTSGLSDVFEVSEHEMDSDVVSQDTQNYGTLRDRMTYPKEPFCNIYLDDMDYCTHL